MPPRRAPHRPDSRCRDAFNLRHHRPAHGDPAKPNPPAAPPAPPSCAPPLTGHQTVAKPRPLTLRCEKCGLVEIRETAMFIIFETPEEGIGFPLSLIGLGEGYDKLP